MICFPLENKPNWKHPPIATILLIVVNVCCFLFFQLDDGKETVEAVEYYFESKLDEIELPKYEDYIQYSGDYYIVQEIENYEANNDEEGKKFFLYQMMRSDGIFLNKLESNEIIKPNEAIYPKWHELHDKYQERLNNITYYRYGLKPYKPSIETLITNMFLHGGIGHLLGNMIFLFLFGFAVEVILGMRIYILAYLLGGIGSGVFDLLLDTSSAIPSIGASGAIAALAGMYTVLFGLRKIRFFCFLFVYFDTFKLPAITILPIWIGYEIYLHFAYEDQVNNLAHLGGYISGAVIAFVTKHMKVKINQDYMDKNINREEFEVAYAEGQKLLAEMKFDKAKLVFTNLYNKYPENNIILKHLFDIEKATPASDKYHRYAELLLKLPMKDMQTVKLQNDVFNDYIKRARPVPKVNPKLLLTLAMKFAAANYMEDSEKIVNYFLKRQVMQEEVSDILLFMIKRYKDSNRAKAKEYLAVLSKISPDKAKLIEV